MSATRTDADTKGFSITSLPCWLALWSAGQLVDVHPRTVDDAEFSIRLDREIVKEGQQSLRFEVARCSAAGGQNSPGFPA